MTSRVLGNPNNSYAAIGDRRDIRDRDFDAMYARPRDSLDRGHTNYSSRGRDRGWGVHELRDPLDNNNVGALTHRRRPSNAGTSSDV